LLANQRIYQPGQVLYCNLTVFLLYLPSLKLSALTVGDFDSFPVNQPVNNDYGLWQKAA